ncbi:WXG100 family type VII secretion target [Saccharothrix syringae]|uniref:WXG100 family type VII secretion target n=1 Tax=Saccharothrix syringae TaxID=103733 RepID=A0A5Q0H7E3_SACSY|nr:WXG100 family type VII secretion target [Saccharothrix syringae]QFZ22121.1 WXG100 family type VII secretion target [Saccharothrix syringae]
MSGGYQVDPDVLTAFAARLDETADEVRAVASTLDDPVGDLGPEGVTEAVDRLMGEWARALRGAGLDEVADGLRAAVGDYRDADEWRRG